MNGNYRFKVVQEESDYWSGDVGHCAIPGCTSAQIEIGEPPIPTEPPSDPLQHAWYVYDGDENMVKGIVNFTTTYYPGRHYYKEVNGADVKVQKFYFAGGKTFSAFCSLRSLHL